MDNLQERTLDTKWGTAIVSVESRGYCAYEGVWGTGDYCCTCVWVEKVHRHISERD